MFAQEAIVAKINPIQMQKYLKGVDYPAQRDDLVQRARDNGADDDLCSMLEQLPEKEYATPAEVSTAMGDLNEE
jgi:hypothetical protein